MSQIATFHTLPEEQSDALLAAATPEIKIIEKRTFLFKKKVEERVDRFWDFLDEHATEQERCQYSGAGFCDLDLALEEKGCMLLDFGSCDLANKISEARAASTAVFDHHAATAALAKLNEVGLSEGEVRKYYQENNPPEDEDLGTEAVLAAFDISRKWLASVCEREIGLLIVG
ncbi:MAG: hypothetical protein HQ567_14370 [Candidatus Nealsonbacteria bacterium]|nr:hypothetical protein [Candidatus Nealsonbacteria bacterium]